MTEIQTENQLRALIGGHEVVVLCFHSTRSAYSRRTLQILAEAEATCAAVKFCLVDADHETFLPLLLEFGVVGLPTILIFRSGVRTKFLVGEHSATALVGHFANWFGNGQPKQVARRRGKKK